jgi:hypothetical protein
MSSWEDMLAEGAELVATVTDGEVWQPRSRKVKKSLVYNHKLDGYELNSPDDDASYFTVTMDARDYVDFKNGKVTLETIAARTHITIPFKNYNIDDEFLPSTTGHPDRIWLRLCNTSGEIKFEIPYGVYTIKTTNYGCYLQEMHINTESYIDIGRSFSDVINDFQRFRGDKEKYNNLGPKKLKRKYRKSCLLYGPPGTGKTTSIVQILSKAKEEKYYVIFVDSNRGILEQIGKFKASFEAQGATVVFVIEELTDRINHDSTEQLLTFLDGEKSWENSYTIATTNYPEELPRNLVDRPGRFSLIKEVAPLNEQETYTLLIGFGLDEEQAQKYKGLLKGLSIDYITFIVTEHFLTGGDITTIFEALKQERSKVSGSFKKGVGLK